MAEQSNNILIDKDIERNTTPLSHTKTDKSDFIIPVLHAERYPLHAAAANEDISRLTQLLDRADFDINMPHQEDEGNTPLHFAARHGSIGCLTLLLERRADLERPNKLGRTALHLAARNDTVDSVENGHALCVAKLLAHKANIAAQDNAGKTPLYLAAETGPVACTMHLLQYGADFNTIKALPQIKHKIVKDTYVLYNNFTKLTTENNFITLVQHLKLLQPGSVILNFAVNGDLDNMLQCLIHYRDGMADTQAKKHIQECIEVLTALGIQNSLSLDFVKSVSCYTKQRC